MKFEIRRTDLMNATTLTVLHAESFGIESWSLEQIRSSLALDTTYGWIAYRDNVAIGFILCQKTPGECEILTFCVQPAAQRQGLGARLFQAVLADAAEDGVDKIHLEVAADNTAARGLYEKFGFKVGHTRPNYYKRGAITVDGLTYQKAESN